MVDLRNGLPIGHGLREGYPIDDGRVWLLCVCGAEDTVSQGDAERQWFFQHATDREATLERIQRRHAAISKGPWSISYESCDCGDGYGCSHGRWPYALQGPKNLQYSNDERWKDHHNSVTEVSELTEEDAHFLANAPTDIDFLLEEVARLRRLTVDRTGGW